MSDNLRDQLAEALLPGAPRFDGYGVFLRDAERREDAKDLADLALPVVRRHVAQVLRAAAQQQRNEAEQVPFLDEGTRADGHRSAADFLDRRADQIAAEETSA